MELQKIVERYAEAITAADASVTSRRTNPRTGEVYRDGVLALGERDLVALVDTTWHRLHAGELKYSALNVRYPALRRTGCDHVLSTDTLHEDPEWGVEVKKIPLVGNNGKRNDFNVTKMLSPFLKDRGLLHDAARLRQHGFTRRVAVIGYVFDYDRDWPAVARKTHPGSAEQAVIAEVEAVMNSNGGTLRPRALVDFADPILRLRGFATGPRAEARFQAWAHPAGGRGLVFGWEIRRPELEPDYDPRHPW